MIYQQGQINLTALLVPGIDVQIVPPQFLLNGVPTNVAGAIGTAQWGPVNAPTIVGSMANYAQQFGAIQPRTGDMGTMVAAAMFQGASDFRCVRITDGTDTAASATLTATDAILPITVGGTVKTGDVLTLAITPDGGTLTTITYTMKASDTTLQLGAVGLAAAVNANAYLFSQNVTADTPSAGVFNLHYGAVAPTVTASVGGSSPTDTLTKGSASTLPGTIQVIFTSKWTGSLGNGIQVILATGGAANSYQVTVALSGLAPEIFTNVGAGLTGAPLWAAIASAINNGISGLRGPSNVIIATAGLGASAPVLATTPLAGGTDGVGSLTTANYLGVDTYPRTGMYALRAQGVSIAAIADLTDTTSWTNQLAFAQSEGIYMIVVGTIGQTISNAVSALAVAGVENYSLKVLLGDWVYFNDTVNNLPQRLISPQGYALGLYANLSPQNSGLNKQMFGIVGTQKSASGQNYTSADIQALVQGGIDVIANPSVGGNYFGLQTGHNSSNNPAVWGDNYTRMTNYIASTINAGMGIYVGQLQSASERIQAKVTLDSFFANLAAEGMIGDAEGDPQPWRVTLDDSNNPFPMVALGYQIATCQVTFLSVIEKFIINLQGGQTVQVVSQGAQPIAS